jgi:hypothetical protein
MFTYQLYNVVHIVGIICIMAGLGGLSLTAGSAAPGQGSARRPAMIFHGIGAFLILLGGFGMLARLGFGPESSWPGWIWGKATIWGILALSVMLPYRFPATARPLLVLLPVLGGAAAYLAIYKPF